MANVLTPTDVYTLVNSAVKEMGGSVSTLTAMNTSTFVTVGEAMLNTGYDTTLNALSLVFARTIVAVRPYKGKFQIIAKMPEEYGAIARKISFFSTELEASDDWNFANTGTTNRPLRDGQSEDHYTIKKVYPLEMNFSGTKVEAFHYTTFRKQLKLAFKNEAEFSRFYTGMMTSIANDLEMKREAENRLHVLNMLGAIYNVGNARMKVNLTSEFNTKFGTSYTTAQLLTTYLKEFTAFLTARIKNDSDLLAENNTMFHLTPSKTDDGGNTLQLKRHTPKGKQKLLLYKPLIRDAETMVFPEIFHDGYLTPENYEGVMYWQNPNVPMGIKITPNQFNVSTGKSASGSAVDVAHIVGCIFDEDALVTATRVDDVITTPVNGRGDYYNTWYHWAFDRRFDMTENMVLYYMAD